MWKAVRTVALQLLPTCVMLGWAVGCADAPSSTSGDSFEVVDSAGVEIVLNGGGEGPGVGSLDVVEDLRLGTIEGERAELLFHNIRDILLDSDGRIYVGNDQTGTVRVFDEDGTFVREFGGKGEGPSEIRSMLNDLKWAGDQIAIIDWQMGGKTILYDTTGAFSDSWYDTRPDGSRISLAGYTPKGWVSVETDDNRPSETIPGRAYPRSRRMRRVAPTLDSLSEVLFELPPRVLYGSAATHGLDWPIFDPISGTGFDGSGNHYRSAGADYRIDVRDPDGNHVRSIRRDYEPIAITGEDIDDYRARVTLRYDTMARFNEPMRQRQIQQSMERIDRQATFPVPETRPPLGAFLVARDGAFWVERLDTRDPAEWWESRMWGGFDDSPEVETSWDVFSAEGRFVGNVKLPPRFMPMAASADVVVGVYKDEFDVEYVVRYRIADQP